MLRPPVVPPRTFGRIGKYTLLGTLADGGMGRVFLAQKDDAEDMCVLKQLHVEIEEEHETASIRFQREAVIASKLDHPNIAKVLDAGFEGGRFYIAMEFIAGQTLDDLARKLEDQGEQLPVEIVLAVFTRVLDGLALAHQHVIHRDLSPRNVMVGYDGAVKIIDFGVARAEIEDDDFRTSPGMLIGTLGYMAPEQALTLDVDHRSDLYALAVVLYEILTGGPLLPPGAPSETIRRIVRERPRPLYEIRPDLAATGLGEVLNRALQKGPDERFQSAAEFRNAITTAWLGDLPSKEELSAFMRELFSEEEQQTEWLLDAARSLKAQHRNFFEDTIEDRFDRYVQTEPDRRIDSGPAWTMAETDPGIADFMFDETTVQMPRRPESRLESETEPGFGGETEIAIPKPPLEQEIRDLGRYGKLRFTLKELPLDETLLLLHESRFTGTLDVGDASEIDRIFFRGGTVVGVSANRKIDAQLFGNALIDLKAVPPNALADLPRGVADLDAALLGRYLLQKGLIDESALERARAEQARRRLYHLFEDSSAPVRVRAGMHRLRNFFPTFVDIRPVVAYGMVVCADPERKQAAVQRLRFRRVKMPVPYDEARNGYGLPPPLVEAIRHLQQDGMELGPVPMLPGIDPMTTAGLLLLLERTSLITVTRPDQAEIPP